MNKDRCQSYFQRIYIIIHAVGPDFSVTPTVFKELFEAYYNSLAVLNENGYHSISLPLISSGIFGGMLDNPAGESAKEMGEAKKEFDGKQ